MATTPELTSIKVNDDKLEIVNQLLLPHVTEYVEINSIEDAYDAIKSMKVRYCWICEGFVIFNVEVKIRGAPAIASLAALSVAQHLIRALRATPPPEFFASPNALQAHVETILAYLYKSRPTAVNLGAATRRLTKTLNDGIAAGKDVQEIVQDLIAEGRLVADEDVGRNKAMAKWGGDWLVEQVMKNGESGEGLNVLTVCNTGSLATSVSDPAVPIPLLPTVIVDTLYRDMELPLG